ncbi:hypothetical protein JZ751_000790 [Albula glossodonta]|uniref:Uncharacterized protein n=1 Tax=Albula glossodonta TaxID=121402 RepID=A0A8T2PXK6_9TELE|nr:hypothetical protein JZ751_000790 [Albula glossodonta]
MSEYIPVFTDPCSLPPHHIMSDASRKLVCRHVQTLCQKASHRDAHVSSPPFGQWGICSVYTGDTNVGVEGLAQGPNSNGVLAAARLGLGPPTSRQCDSILAALLIQGGRDHVAPHAGQLDVHSLHRLRYT